MQEEPRPRWSLNLCKINKIPVRVHASFLLLLAWVALEETSLDSSALNEVLFVLAIFGCVLLHELGHTFVAQFFGIKTRDIVLYPFGGIASIESTPSPKAEFFISIAGPLVNVLLALLLFYGADLKNLSSTTLGLSFSERLFFANIILAIFNLLPALPMDGGRVLRSILELLKLKSATIIAARISQLLSLLLAAVALYIGDVILLIIAIFVFLNAFQEHFRARSITVAKEYTVRDVMTEAKDLLLLEHGMTVTHALSIVSKSPFAYYPVLHGDTAIGILKKTTLLAWEASEDSRYISEIMNRDFPTADPDDELLEIIKRIHAGAKLPFIVNKNDIFVGMILEELLVEFLFLNDNSKASNISKEVPA